MNQEEIIKELRNLVNIVQDSGLIDITEILKGEGLSDKEIYQIIEGENQDIQFENFDIKNKILEYQNSGFYHCPVCGKLDNINWDYEEIEPDSFFIYRVHYCEDCNSKWEERYSIDKVKLIKE